MILFSKITTGDENKSILESLNFVFLFFFLEMKKNNLKSFSKKKSHNQKIHDAHVLRTQEKKAAKQVIDLFFFL